MVSGGIRRGGHHRGGSYRGVGQQGVDEALLQKYHQAKDLVAPVERDEEKRNVHRVREYWLEHEAVNHLDALLALQVPVATFENHFLQANANNPKYGGRNTFRETVRTFFREHVDEHGVKFLTLKLSERPVCTKPSKNILKRWNLSNGMLYFFYAAIGRSSPPTGDEILEPFYYQKRIDFIRKVCGGPLPSSSSSSSSSTSPLSPSASSSFSDLAATAAGGGGSHDFFLHQEQLQQQGRSRKRRREPSEVPLPLSSLYIPAGEAVVPATPTLSSSRIKQEEGEGGEPTSYSTTSPPNEEALASLLAFLRAHVCATLDEKAVRKAVEEGVWQLVTEESVDSSTEPSLAYLERPLRSFWVPELEKLEQWSYANGCLGVFVRACRLQWHRVEAAWSSWNEDLGNNALEWSDLWGSSLLLNEEEEEEEAGGCGQGQVVCKTEVGDSLLLYPYNAGSMGAPQEQENAKVARLAAVAAASPAASAALAAQAAVAGGTSSSSSSALPLSLLQHAGNARGAAEDIFNVPIDLSQEEGEGGERDCIPFLKQEEGQGEEGQDEGEEGERPEEEDGISAGTTGDTTMAEEEGGWVDGGGIDERLDLGLDMTDSEFQAMLMEGENDPSTHHPPATQQPATGSTTGGEGGGEACAFMDDSFFFAYPGTVARSGSQVSAVDGGLY